MRYAVIVAAALLALAGCARRLPVMTRADMTAHDRDHYECTKEAAFPQTIVMPIAGVGPMGTTRMMVDIGLYSLCMKARGYQETAKP
jgi:hypothetical protein